MRVRVRALVCACAGIPWKLPMESLSACQDLSVMVVLRRALREDLEEPLANEVIHFCSCHYGVDRVWLI